jgi:hypothetical protein
MSSIFLNPLIKKPAVDAAGEGENYQAQAARKEFSMSNCSTKIFVSGHCVGEVKNGAFIKSIVGSRHLLTHPPAIALSVDSLKQAKALGATEIRITDRETGTVYSADIAYFEHYSFPVQRGGYEAQRALPLERFSVTMTATPAYQSMPTITASVQDSGPLVKTETVQLSFTF